MESIEFENQQTTYDSDYNSAGLDSYIDDVSVQEPTKDEFSWGREIYSWIKMFVVALVLAFLINNFVLLNAEVPSGSMENTILTESRMLGNRLVYKMSDPQRGDVIIFEFPDDPNQLFVKRVIGLPGEKVTIRDAKVYINDSEIPLDEDYLKEEWVSSNDGLEYNVPEECYFVMGDNRNNSRDSRFWNNTYVKRSAVKAKAMVVYWPTSHINVIKSYTYEIDTVEK